MQEWLRKAKNRLAREENLNALNAYTDRLIDINKKHGVAQLEVLWHSIWFWKDQSVHIDYSWSKVQEYFTSYSISIDLVSLPL